MAKTHPVGVRLDPEVRAALERAAKADKRSLSAFIHKELEGLAVAKGWLKAEASP